MAHIRQFFKKARRTAQTLVAAIATMGMVTAVTPTVAHADGPQHNFSNFSGVAPSGYKKHHRGFRGHNRGFRGHNRGFKRHHNRGFRGHNRGYKRHHHRGFKRYHRRNNGAAIAAGIIGLTAGAIIASEVNRNHRSKRHYKKRHVSYEPYTAEWYAACARKYRSFNARTGRYLAHSGKYRLCRI